MAERIENDAYMTPRNLAFAICTRLTDLQPQTIMEPSAGNGAFLDAAFSVWPDAHEFYACEKDPKLAAGIMSWASVANADFLTLKPTLAVDLVIGNPPYNDAEAFVRTSMRWVRPGGYVAFLLRLSFIASQSRVAGLYAEFPIFSLAAIAPRPSFTVGGNDNSEYGLFVWKRGHTGYGIIDHPLLWVPPAKKRKKRQNKPKEVTTP